MKTIFITGGHLTPAIAVCQGLQHSKWQIYYIGRKHSLEGDKALSQEYLTTQKLGIYFLPITTGRWQRTLTRFSLMSLFKMPIGFIQAFLYIVSKKPDVVLSFGGYVAVPVVVVAWISGIPVVTHEQTMAPGFANKIISIFTEKICLGWEETARFFPKSKIIYTGNPLRKEIFQTIKSLVLPSGLPVVYIAGGNQGSHAINVIVEQVLEKLIKRYVIVHQTGNAQRFKDCERMVKLKETFPQELKKNYHPFQYITSEYIGSLFHQTDVVVGRAGANIVSELIVLGKPSLLIPLPWSGESEQIKNAKYLTDQKAAMMIEQKDLTPELLLETLDTLIKEKKTYSKVLEKLKHLVPPDAAEKIIHVVESVV